MFILQKLYFKSPSPLKKNQQRLLFFCLAVFIFDLAFVKAVSNAWALSIS